MVVQALWGRRPTCALGIQRRDMAPCGQQSSGQVLRWRRDISSGKSQGKNCPILSPPSLPLWPPYVPYEQQVGWWVGATVLVWTQPCDFGETFMQLRALRCMSKGRSPCEKPCDVGNCEYCPKSHLKRLPSHQVTSNTCRCTGLALVNKTSFYCFHAL